MERTRRLVLAATALVAAVLAFDTPHVSADAAPAVPAVSYIVRPGDNLVGIARKTGARLADLLAANNLITTSMIHPGDILTVPGPSGPGTTPATGVNTSTSAYTVVRGDSLAGIARKNGVTLKALLASNSLTASSVIHPGQALRLPTGATPTTAAPPKLAPTIVANAPPSEVLVTYLRSQVGKPYKFFTAGPDTFDCSGLVVAGYKQLGITLIHQSRMQASMGTAVDWRNAPVIAGDLVFVRSSNDPTTPIGHVGIALDSKTWIQAPGSGVPVRISPLPADDRIEAVRRILPEH